MHIFSETETGNIYERMNAQVDTCMDQTAPNKGSTESKRSDGKESSYRKALLIFISLWFLTLIVLIFGLVLYCYQRSAIQKLEALKDSTVRETPKVAFSASLVNNSGKISLGPHSEDHILVYSHIITNVGGAYNSSSGIFTAPIRGVYYISFTAFGWSQDHPTGAALFLNHAFCMRAYDNQPGDGRGTTSMITLQLEKADILYLKLKADTQLHDNGNLYNTFNGHLLFPI